LRRRNHAYKGSKRVFCYLAGLSLPTHADLANKHGIAKSTLSARINGCPSKLVSASKWKNIFPDEERLIVNYLQETARRGFPDTPKQCILCANEILRMRSGLPPLLMNVVLEHSMGQSDMGSSSCVNKRNVRRGKGRQHSILIDPMLAEYLDIDDIGSDEESDSWLAHDE